MVKFTFSLEEVNPNLILVFDFFFLKWGLLNLEIRLNLKEFMFPLNSNVIQLFYSLILLNSCVISLN